MKPLKDIYANAVIFRQLSQDMKQAYPALQEKEFFASLIKNLSELELLARVERVADVCHQFLPQDYARALAILYRFADGKESNFLYIFLPAFVAKYGLQHFNLSLKALRDFTQYSSSEAGVRPFLASDLERTLDEMKKWACSGNVHIRRLSSEGCRPRLPWARKVPALCDDPQLAWPILELLKEDPEKYVQKSVANHINDISKDHADWLIARIKGWDLSHPITKWIVAHGLRTLIKKGHKGALALTGHHHKPQVQLVAAQWDKTVRLGEQGVFTVKLLSQGKQKQSLVIDYNIHFLKSNGTCKPKTFKLKKVVLKPDEHLSLRLQYTFKDMTTRKHYPGLHMWQLLINGEPQNTYAFHVQR